MPAFYHRPGIIGVCQSEEMPELPEVERARKLIQDTCRGYKIASVDSTPDTIVYTGGDDHEAFACPILSAKEMLGRTIESCERKGKIFWMNLSGQGRMPVMHFGMTGMVILKGVEPAWYVRRHKEVAKAWPPRFYKFALKLEPQEGSVSDEPRELAFIDSRRLGRLRLLPAPVHEHPPISLLGFDPVLNHPSFEEFKGLLAKKKGTVKHVLLDQSFSAGVGNWIADEILYQSRIHPATPVPALSETQLEALHHYTRAIPLRAVEVNAEHKQFPSDWLFRHRWGKGTREKKSKTAKAKAAKRGNGKGQEGSEEEEGIDKGQGEEEGAQPTGKRVLALPDGSPATIEFIDVAGRTSAFVPQLQVMPEGFQIKIPVKRGKKHKKGDSDTEESELSSEADVKVPVVAVPPKRRAVRTSKVKTEELSESPASPVKRKRKAPLEGHKNKDKDKVPRRRRSGAGIARSRVKDSSELSDAPDE
ncbi:hypothetical protein BCR39DRAFT_551063 [Naematelia encephala]|uniref:Formamidopyrimidine-DNA glycosylase catalytic domain-containing protein n=1 Tax=Naematelia encephala TaxID=71784 RepID=A0A1Y2AKD3_9TREE|nr:hypothetical protein BCR39DRAFT_551063 [Naematelia encephala]